MRAGKSKRLNDTQVTSAIDKVIVEGEVRIGPLGLEGDEQAQKPLHGGPEKAVLHYAAHHYPAWQAEVPTSAPYFRPGGFGENLVSRGLDETNMCIGDKVRVGPVLLQVAQPRQPCFKLNHRFDEPTMMRRALESGRTGWYYRVLEAGSVKAGDVIQIIERPHPEWPVRRVQHLVYTTTLDRDALAVVVALPPLAESARKLFEHRLKAAGVENWQPHRLQHAYLHAMAAGIAYVPEPSCCCLIGLGGGALARFLNHYLPELTLDVVEIDPAVVSRARDHFGAVPKRIFVEDGREYLRRSAERYDLIVIDAHLHAGERTDRNGHPLSLKNKAFYDHLRARLRPGGVAVFNVVQERDAGAYIEGIQPHSPAST